MSGAPPTPEIGDPLAGLSPESRAIIERQAADLAAKQAAAGPARREPFPGPLQAAFADLPTEIAGLRVRPVVHYDFIILKRVDSPLLRQLAIATTAKRKGKSKVTPFSDEESYAMIYQFTRPVRELAAWWDRQPDPARAVTAFRQLAREEIGLRLGPFEVGTLIGLIEREFVATFATAISYASTDESGGTVFTPPPAPAMTASAGGSTISAASPAHIRD